MGERDPHFSTDSSSSSNVNPSNRPNEQPPHVQSEPLTVDENSKPDEQSTVDQSPETFVIHDLFVEEQKEANNTESSNPNPNEHSSLLLTDHLLATVEVNLSSVKQSSAPTLTNDNHDGDPNSEKPDLSTYVVQVPKDQVYRVPPPENAKLVERHRTILNNKNKPKAWCSRCLCCLLFISIVVVLGVIAGIAYVFLRP